VPLGATRHVRYEDQELELEPGSVLAMYTDGLIERSDEPPAARLQRLLDTVSEGAENLEHMGDALVDVLLPTGPGSDDAALLLARALPLGQELVAQFPAEIESIPMMRRLLGRWLDDAGASQRDVDDLALASAEAAANAIEHAYGLEAGIVELRASPVGDDGVKVAIRDFGHWRSPRGTHRGRGLLLMEGLADDVQVIRSDLGTTVELSRRIGLAAA